MDVELTRSLFTDTTFGIGCFPVDNLVVHETDILNDICFRYDLLFAHVGFPGGHVWAAEGDAGLQLLRDIYQPNQQSRT